MSYALSFVILSLPQAKYQIPRDPQLRSSYRASKLQRPKLKIHGAWCFGHTLQLAILEENTYHGSAMVQELLRITLEAVMQQCQDAGQPSPDTLVVVGDNTVKELKNGVNLAYLANLVNHGCFRLLDSHSLFSFVSILCLSSNFPI